MSKVIIVGGGASGMMAAVFAARKGNTVKLYEQNDKLGKKVFITGKGRCNITNACDTQGLFQNMINNPKFLYSAFYGFDNFATMRFFEEAGCSLKIERGERVFPISDHSSDVIKVLQEEMKKSGVEILLNTRVQNLWIEEDEIKGVFLQKNQKEEADAVLLATGGISYPLTGATGDGYQMAKENGHTITQLSPALVPFEVKESWCADLQGLALKNVGASLEKDGKQIYEGFGEMLFTHYGVSGPLILSASSFLAKQGKGTEVILHLDLKKALTIEQLDKRILRDFEENKNKQFKNAIVGLFPIKLIPIMIEVSGICPEKKVYEITKEERLGFAKKIKDFKLTITRLRDYKEAIITNGGIEVKEINPSTMESKKIKGLYFAGEVMDVDALTGGFNLQIAWSTGCLAGSSME